MPKLKTMSVEEDWIPLIGRNGARLALFKSDAIDLEGSPCSIEFLEYALKCHKMLYGKKEQTEDYSI